MKKLDRSTFKENKQISFNGQCMCPVNCSSKISSYSKEINEKMKEFYVK